MKERVQTAVATMPPASFSLVMATGIVSLAAELSGFPKVSRALFWLNNGFFLWLWAKLGLRLLWFPGKVIADLGDHGRGVGFFTLVAGTAVLGNQFVLLGGSPRMGLALWLIAFGLWLVLTYTVFTLLTVKREKPSLADGIHGGWLVSVVAAQSVSVLGSLLTPHFPDHAEHLLFVSLLAWLVGGMLYVWLIALLFYRYTFFAMPPDHLSPPYWINMGAMAVSTVAGTFLISCAGESALLSELLPCLKAMTLLFWATATWWIPMIVALGFWRHILCRIPFAYDPLYWSMVFPLGMYTVATHRLAGAIGFPSLRAISAVTVWAALASWLVTCCGLLARSSRAAVGADPLAPR
jgi:tellurite resistance protein TehA-like permease